MSLSPVGLVEGVWVADDDVVSDGSGETHAIALGIGRIVARDVDISNLFSFVQSRPLW